MALIRWQTNAKRHFKSLFDYYREHASEIVALGLRNTITDDVEKLKDFPNMGINHAIWDCSMNPAKRRSVVRPLKRK